MKQPIIPTISLITLLVAPIQSVFAQTQNHVEVYLTARDTGQRLAKTGESELAASPPVVEKEEYIFVDPTKTFQTIIGIGGALTDASAETFYKLPEDRQREILRAYFDPQTGIGYTPGRTHIHSCDFSSESYIYIKDGDKQLDSFDISHDLKYRIPFIKAAMTEAGNHFSKFVRPGAKRITSSSTTNKLLTTVY
jgi:glucosylceramidase